MAFREDSPALKRERVVRAVSRQAAMFAEIGGVHADALSHEEHSKLLWLRTAVESFAKDLKKPRAPKRRRG